MKQILTAISIIVIFCGVSFAQEYVSFPTENASWHVLYSGTCHEGPSDTVVFKFTIQGDTLVDETAYRALFLSIGDSSKQVTIAFGAIREEDKKIYYTGNTMLGLNTYEIVLLYDFTKQIGDTIRHDSYDESEKYSVVLNIDSVLIGEKYRKRFMVDNNWYYHNPDTIIEGIGSVKNGLIGHISDITTCGHHYWEHICFKQNNEVLYQNPNYDSCEPIFKKNSFEQIPVSQIKIYPNPLSKGETVTFENIDFEVLEIYNPQGVCIERYKIDCVNKYELNTNGFLPGIYIYKLSTNGIPLCGKLVVK